MELLEQPGGRLSPGLPYSAMLAEYGIHCVTAQATTNFLKELTAGDLIRVDGEVARVGTKSVTFRLGMHHAETGETHATYDLVEVFFDPKTRRSTAMPEAIRQALQAWLAD